MYRNEMLITYKFLAKLKELNVTTIPFRTEAYRDGVYAMAQYFDSHLDGVGEDYLDVRLLFVHGGERDLAKAIMQCDNHVTLQNPQLDTVTLSLSDGWAKAALDDDELNLSDTFLSEITKSFCEAANVRGDIT